MFKPSIEVQNTFARVRRIVETNVEKLGILPETAGSRILTIQNEARDSIREKNDLQVRQSLRQIEDEIKQLKASDSSNKREHRLASLIRSRDECVSYVKNDHAKKNPLQFQYVDDVDGVGESTARNAGLLTYEDGVFKNPVWKAETAGSPGESATGSTLGATGPAESDSDEEANYCKRPGQF